MTEPLVDMVCGCPAVFLASNRRDRRRAARQGQVSVFVVKHRRGCVRRDKSLSDPGRLPLAPIGGAT